MDMNLLRLEISDNIRVVRSSTDFSKYWRTHFCYKGKMKCVMARIVMMLDGVRIPLEPRTFSQYKKQRSHFIDCVLKEVM